MARETDASRWFDNATDTDVENLVKDLEDANLSETKFREKYPFSSGATRPYLKEKGISVKTKGKGNTTTSLPSSEIDFSQIISICPDDIERINTYVSGNTLERLEKAFEGRRPIYKAAFMDLALNYALDVLEGNNGVIAIDEIPSKKLKKKPGRKKLK